MNKQFWKSSIGKILYTQCPYITFAFVEEYFETLDVVNGKKKPDNVEDGRLPIEVLQYRCMLVIHLLNIGHFVYLHVVPAQSRWTQLILMDFFKLLDVPDMLTIRYCGIIFCSAFFYWLMYVNVSGKYCTEVVRKVIIGQDLSFVLNSSIPFRKLTLYSLYLYQVMIAMVACYCTGVHIRICRLMFGLYWDDLWSWSGLLALISMHIFAMSTYSTIYGFLFIGYVTITYLVMASMVCFARLIEVRKILEQGIRTRNQSQKLRILLRFRTLHIESMKYIFSVADVYGKFLLCGMTTTIPLNTAGVMMSLLGLVDPFNRFFFLCYNCGLYTGIFIAHCNAAIYCKMIHKPYKRLIAHNAKLRTGTLSERIKLAISMEKFHTKKRYGITYLGNGLVTVGSFIKYILMYSEVMMYNYQLLRESYS